MDKIIKVYTKKEELKSIISNLDSYEFKDLYKTPHFKFSLLEKDTDIKLLEETYSQKQRIKMVHKRKHKNGKASYDFYYALQNGRYLLYAISFEDKYDKPSLINAYLVNRNFNQFKQKILKRYGRSMF